MNEITLLREAGPKGPALTTEARQAARAALMIEIGGRPTLRRRRRPGRRLALRVGAGLAAVAAAWAGAVVITAPDPAAPPPGSVTLVDFDMPTFPLSLPAPPPGTSGPTFEGGSDGTSMHYLSANRRGGLHVSVRSEEPDPPLEGFSGEMTEQDVVVDGRDGSLTVLRPEGSQSELASLVWERASGQWVTVYGEGRYGNGGRLSAVAEALVDRPQAVPLKLQLAPAGWSVDFFKEGGRILTLRNDAHPEQDLTLHVPMPEEVVPADELRGQLKGPVGPVIPVTVHERPAQLVRIDHGGGHRGWYLQAQFPDGTTFVVQAPAAFTQDQLVAFAN